MKSFFFILLFPFLLFATQQKESPFKLGVDRFFEEEFFTFLGNKRVGLITNHTGVNSKLESTAALFEAHCHLAALFAPEHGLSGASYASEKIQGEKTEKELPIYSLHGQTKRPTDTMLKAIDVLVFDIQEIGSRSYTYASTLFYAMEEAAKRKIQFIVLDRPNPMGGIIVDGPMLQEKWRSFLGYINIPYCHGMTIGELAQFFNAEYGVKASLQVIPMKGWKREMLYQDTGLAWIPTSPNIPEPDTPFYYASTGILGALNIVSIGIGYTLPFKIVGAPWIHAQEFAQKLNKEHLPGVQFLPFHYRPFYGKFKDELCHGVHIVITDPHLYRPLAVQYLLIGMLKSLYPRYFEAELAKLSKQDQTSFCKVNGNEEMLEMIQKEKYVAWKLIEYDQDKRKEFLLKRAKYLLYD